MKQEIDIGICRTCRWKSVQGNFCDYPFPEVLVNFILEHSKAPVSPFYIDYPVRECLTYENAAD